MVWTPTQIATTLAVTGFCVVGMSLLVGVARSHIQRKGEDRG